MPEKIGKYQLQKNENLDGFFRSIGVPFLARKMMAATTPIVEISTEEDGTWTIKTSTLLRTTELKFKSGEEYEEIMPSGVVLKCTTTVDGEKIVTLSKLPDDSQTTRTYTFTDEGMLLVLTHDKSGETANRHFLRISK